MASAAPMLVGYLASNAVAKIGESQGWDPTLTTFLSVAAGAGAGSVGAGIGATATPAASGMTNSLFAPGTTAGTATLGGITQPSAGGLLGGSTPTVIGSSLGAGGSMSGAGWFAPGAASSLNTPISNNGLVWGNPNLTGIQPVFDPLPLSAASLSGVTSPTMDPVMVGGKASAIKDAWNSTWKDENFIKSLGTTMIDGMFAEQPRKQPLGGGGGGGGGGSAPAYQGGGGGGQYGLIQSFPQRGTSIQWQEVA